LLAEAAARPFASPLTLICCCLLLPDDPPFFCAATRVPARPPVCLQVPFSSFEEALKKPENKALAAELAAAIQGVAPAAAGQHLARCRDLAMKVGAAVAVLNWLPGAWWGWVEWPAQAANVHLVPAADLWTDLLSLLSRVPICIA
jgi:hypothetical protein